MTLLSAEFLTFGYGSTALLSDASFSIEPGEKVGLVGANGTGKSTLLRLICGMLQPRSGRIWLKPGTLVGYTEADPATPLELNEELVARLGIQEEMLSRPLSHLSGGQRTRIALLWAFSQRPALVLLDEPTNYLDLDGLTWLEEFVKKYRGAAIVASHDRYFLDRTVTRVLALEGGKVNAYAGNYSHYASVKAAARAAEEQAFLVKKQMISRLQATVEKQADWVAQASQQDTATDRHRSRLTRDRDGGRRMAARLRANQQRLERLGEELKAPEQEHAIRFHLSGQHSGGNKLVEFRNVSFGYDSASRLFRDASFVIPRGARVALLGPNGCGKTTLAKLISGALPPSEGTVYLSPGRIGYLEQGAGNLPPDESAFSVLKQQGMTEARARSTVAQLLLTEDRANRPLHTLSQGERIRVALAQLVAINPDVLILDEPTDTMDIASRDVVTEALSTFQGTLILISHDRYLLKQLATSLLLFEKGSLTYYPGSYDEFQDRKAPVTDKDQRLLLELRLAELANSLHRRMPKERKEELRAEFIKLSRQLR